jgi:hypothetical protein
MEFNEIKNIWSVQDSESGFDINKSALYDRVLARKKQAYNITNVSELVFTVINLGSGFVMLGLNATKQNIFLYLLSSWMFITALTLGVGRIWRLKGSKRFNRSVAGDLSHAIAVAKYQVRLSQLMRWNLVPVAALLLLAVVDDGKPFWVVAIVLLIVVVGHLAGGWEHTIYKGRLEGLKILQKKLEREEPAESTHAG